MKKTSLNPRLIWLVLLLVLLNLLIAACSNFDTNSLSDPNSMLTSNPTPVVAPTPTPITVPPAPMIYAGWAYDAYPSTSYEQMVKDVRRIKDAGANILWISHANPALPFKQEREVGLNPAVLDAYRDFAQFPHDDAVDIVESQKQMLRACREVGMKVVLSIGYHTQMGQEWSKRHPDDLRRQPNGKLWQVTNGNDPFASIYSPAFQADMQEYYRWIEQDYVSQFSDVIVMLNLADEPSGGDYSKWANAEFKKRTGYDFSQVGQNQARQQALGQFQAGMIVDFTKLVAGYWYNIRPGLPVTMSFDGGAMREDSGMPNLEALFRDAPSNFVFTWDMYPRDRGSLNVSLNEADVSKLIYLVRAIGGYSAQYGRKVWLWSAANSWGLGQGVSQPGTIADAQANLIYLAQLMVQTGGKLEGLAIWNYNIKLQGLYNYSYGSTVKKATWNEDDMFNRVSSLFPVVRQIMAEQNDGPQVVFLRPPEWQYQQIGTTQADVVSPQLDYTKLDMLARNNIVSVEVGHWPEQLPVSWGKVTTVVVLSPPEYLTQSDLTRLKDWALAGGTLVGPLGLATPLTGQPTSVWNSQPTLQGYGKGRLFFSREPTYSLFDSSQAEKQKLFWRDLFGLEKPEDGWVIATRTSYLHYHLGAKPAAASFPGGQWSSMSRYSLDGLSQPLTPGNVPVKPLQRSEFIFATK